MDREHRRRKGERENRRTPPFPPSSAPFKKRKGRRRPFLRLSLGDAERPLNRTLRVPLPSPPARPRGADRVLHPSRRGALAHTLGAKVSPPSYSPPSRRGALDSSRTRPPFLFLASQPPRPAAPGLSAAEHFSPSTHTTREPPENFLCVIWGFVHILGRARSPGWMPEGVRDLTMRWGGHHGNPTPLTRFYSRATRSASTRNSHALSAPSARGRREESPEPGALLAVTREEVRGQREAAETRRASKNHFKGNRRRVLSLSHPQKRGATRRSTVASRN